MGGLNFSRFEFGDEISKRLFWVARAHQGFPDKKTVEPKCVKAM
jgi:hypothetical protein